MQNDLGPRPLTISFAPECFEVVGQRETYMVVMGGASYPKRFAVREDAEAFARRVGRVVTVGSRNILRRVKW